MPINTENPPVASQILFVLPMGVVVILILVLILIVLQQASYYPY